MAELLLAHHSVNLPDANRPARESMTSVPATHGPVGRREAELVKEPSRLRRLFKILGPGFITGASDADPTSIGTYAKAGATLGFGTLWMSVLVFPLLAGTQFICSKIGMVSGMGLSAILRRHYPRPVGLAAVFALVVANVINAGADLGAIAAAINLLMPAVPIAALIVPVGLLALAFQVWGSYRLIERTFKWLALALLAYVAAGILARPDPIAVLTSTFVPPIRFDRLYLSTIVAILGTVISPYLFFWQSTEEVEEKVSMGRRQLWQRRGTTDAEMTYAVWDVNIGILFSVLVMYFVILATAATLYGTGGRDLDSAAQVAEALRPAAGNAAAILLALGLIGSGFLTVPILTSSSAFALADAFGWRSGLDERPRRARRFYAVIAAATVAAMAMNYLGINPIAALFWSSVINGFVAPPLLLLIMLIANNRQVMGERVNGRLANVLGWITCAAMFAAAIGSLLT